MQISEVAGATDADHPRTVGGVRGWPPETSSQKTQKIILRVDQWPDLWTVDQAMGRGPDPWIETPETPCLNPIDT